MCVGTCVGLLTICLAACATSANQQSCVVSGALSLAEKLRKSRCVRVITVNFCVGLLSDVWSGSFY